MRSPDFRLPRGLAVWDAHQHVFDERLEEDIDVILATCRAVGVAGGVVNGTHPRDWPKVERLVAERPWLKAAYGLHPWYVHEAKSDWRETLRDYLERHPDASVGECGLDRWVLDSGRNAASLEEQAEALEFQLELAAELHRPVTLHCLRAWERLAEVAAKRDFPNGFLLHAYGGPEQDVAAWAKRGAYFSFNAAFLESRKTRQQAAFRAVPRERLLLETDAPSMLPPPEWREFSLEDVTVNHPGNLRGAAFGLSQLLGEPLESLLPELEENFQRLFG